MSNVRENERSKSKLEVIVKASELALYTHKILKNKNVFDPEIDDLTIEHLKLSSKNIYKYTYMANSIRVGNALDWVRRDNYQNIAIDCCAELLINIGLAKSLYHLRSKRVKYWSGLIVEERKLIRAWNESDSRRYKDYLEQLDVLRPWVLTLATEDKKV